jgi:hypothetical protein
MNEITRWILGLFFALVVGSYGYSYSSTTALEDRLTRQLDIIERKIDRVIEHQYNYERKH